MKTLVILSHPNLNESSSQQFLINAIAQTEDVKIHHLEQVYPDGKIDRQSEQDLLKSYQRIIFQFPFYWYSSPSLLKDWQDVVFGGEDFYRKTGTILTGKEFGLVLTIGIKASDYRAGGRERFTLDELTRPFQAVAHHMGMTYLPAFAIHQFAYMAESQKKSLLIDYQYYLTGGQPASLETRTEWLINQLEKTNRDTLSVESRQLLEPIIAELAEKQSIIHDLKLTMEEF